ncbi:MAG: hypothetical protein JJU13_11875 [Balneolaceae bacterium]|nr:hypothetical protein [Balneolaceae bacterium]
MNINQKIFVQNHIKCSISDFCNLIIIIILFSNCSKIETDETSYRETIISDNDFGEIVTLEANEIDQINTHLIHPRSIHLSDSMLVVVERDVSDGIFKIFSLTDFSFLGSYGSRGEGPGEYSQIISNIVQTRDSFGKSPFVVLDWVHKRLTNISLEDILSGNIQGFEDSYILPPELMLSQRATFLNDTTVISMGGSDKGILAYVNTKTDSVSYIPFIPKIDENLSSRDATELYRGEFVIDKQRGRIVAATKWFPEMIIFDVEGEVQNVIRIPVQDHPANKLENQRTLFYKDLKITDKYIYGVYLKASQEEMGEIYNNYHSKDFSYSTEIHVFDWSGEPVRKIILEDKFLPFIEIDSINHQLFAIDVFSEDMSLLLFESEVIQ